MSYSIAIRTIGKGGKVWQKLVQSIANQSILPDKVFVVLPENFENTEVLISGLPNCVPLFTRKGMVHQRVFGLEQAEKLCSSDFVLCLDDDVEFPPDFADKSLNIIQHSKADFLAPRILLPHQDPNAIPSRWSPKNIINALTGLVIYSSKSKFKIEIIASGGYKANPWLKGTVPTQSLNGPAFWIRNNIQAKLDYRSEYWVEQIKYALPDDQVLGYKAYLLGFNLMYTDHVTVTHLDAKSTLSSDRQFYIAEARGRNLNIFWHRFLKIQNDSRLPLLVSRFKLFHSQLMLGVSFLLNSIISRNFSSLKGFRVGRAEAKRVINSQEFKSLPKVLS